MNRVVISCVVAMSVALSASSSKGAVVEIEGTVKSVDAKKRMITVETGKETKTFDVSSKAKIIVKEKDAALDGLQSGAKVKLHYHDSLEIVVKIEITSAAPNANDLTILFDGKTLKGWKALGDKKTSGWDAKNGELVLVPTENTPPLMTTETFDDFEFECEFWLDSKANSGVFLRGRYEVQLVDDDAYPRFRPNQMCGAIYDQFSPSQMAFRGAGKWNTLTVRLEQKTATVVLNGVKIIEQQNISKVTPGAVDSDEDRAGPIVLQAHTGSVRFKNIKVRRLKS